MRIESELDRDLYSVSADAPRVPRRIPDTTKLNLGSGEQLLEGYENRDGQFGDCLFPLPDPDGSMDEIRASHVLEHFPHAQIPAVMEDWVRVLKPGGTLKIAVPDFELIAHGYVQGASMPVQGFIMGGQVDERDHHKALFDWKTLNNLMRRAGLVAVRPWKSEIQDCAALPISLNLQATKPVEMKGKVAGVISVPRLGFNDFWGCAAIACERYGIPIRKSSGAYWDKALTQGIEEAIAEYHPEWILTADYDTVFTMEQLGDLMDLARRYPHADAIAPLQTARWHNSPMFTAAGPDGQILRSADRDALAAGELIRSKTAHLGLTLFRVEALRKLEKPWFVRQFDEAGNFDGNGALDPDVNFWHNWERSGNTLYVALRVPVGHCELMIRWPDVNLEPAFQLPGDFWKDGPPKNLWR